MNTTQTLANLDPRCYVEFFVNDYGTAEASATKPKFRLASILQRSKVTHSGAQTTLPPTHLPWTTLTSKMSGGAAQRRRSMR